jgi:hypothetical protein
MIEFKKTYQILSDITGEQKTVGFIFWRQGYFFEPCVKEGFTGKTLRQIADKLDELNGEKDET